LALVVFLTTTIPIWQRGIYYLFNALLIFSIAVGTNQVGAITARPRPPEVPEFTERKMSKEEMDEAERQKEIRKRISEINDEVPSLQQQLLENNDAAKDPKFKQQIRNLNEELRQLEGQVEALNLIVPDATAESSEPFFRAWFD
jgi:flagellar motility protein MotE (MotC chaperone)